MTHALTPPSHSIISQHMVVSQMHEDIAHNLSVSHSDSVDIETGVHQLRSPTSFVSQSSLEPNIHIRTQSMSTACLSDIAKTPRVVPSIGVSQGPGGNPTSAITLPTLKRRSHG